MKIEKGKVKMECQELSSKDGLVISVNDRVAMCVRYDEDEGLVHTMLYHKDYDDAAATRAFMEINR